MMEVGEKLNQMLLQEPEFIQALRGGRHFVAAQQQQQQQQQNKHKFFCLQG